MHPAPFSTIELLESRTLFTATSLTLTADQQQLSADKAAYATDMRTSKNLIAADKARVNADSLQGRKNLITLGAKLAKDQALRKTLLAGDRANAKTAATGDNAIILRDKVAMRVDKANPTQLAADQKKMIADEILVQSDRLKFNTILFNDDASTQSTILADQLAIVTARSTVDNTALLADQKTLLSDQQASLKTLAADQIQILQDQLKITQDTATA